MNEPNPWQHAMNLLCVRLDSLGDVLMTTPAFRALKESAPGRRLTLLTSQAGTAAAHCVPELDDVWTYDAPWMKATAGPAESSADFAMIERLKQARFDGAIVFTVYSQNPLPAALYCRMAETPLRLAHCRENPYQLLTDWLRESEPEHYVRHEVQRQLDLVASIGCSTSNTRLSLEVPAAARDRVLDMMNRVGVDAGDRWLVMHPGASAPSRRYPAEGFAAVADCLIREDGFQVVFTGTTAERELVEGIQDMISVPTTSLAGTLSFSELAALLQGAPLLISNNTGPVHIAAAVGTPVVDLYALTNPQHTPWGVACRVLFHDVPCKYCYKSLCPEGHHDCLQKVRPETVVAAARSLLDRPLQAHPCEGGIAEAWSARAVIGSTVAIKA